MGPGKISVKLTGRGNPLALLSQATKPESAWLSGVGEQRYDASRRCAHLR